MGPDELLGDGAFRNVAQVFKERSLLEVNIHAVSVTVMLFADEFVLLDEEGVFRFSTTALEAGE